MADLSAGSADRWVTCPASAGAPLGSAPRERSELSMECRAADGAANAILDGEVQSWEELVGRGLVDVPMARRADEFAAKLRACPLGLPSLAMLQEWRPRFPGETGCRVALDAGGRLLVATLDYGYQADETPQECARLHLEAASAIRRIPSVNFVDLAIFRPRVWRAGGPWIVYRTTPEFVEQRGAFAVERADQAERPNPPARPSRRCRGCARAVGCEALASDAAQMYQALTELRGGRRMTGAELAEALDFAHRARKLLEAYASAVEGEAEARLGAGETVPGWWMEEGAGHRQWTVPVAVRELATGHSATKIVEKTPAEMEREGAAVGALAKPGRGKRRLARFDSAAIAARFGG